MELIWALYGIGFVVVALVFLYLAKGLFDLVTPYHLNVQLSEKNNPAVGLVLFGYLIGVIAVISGTFSGDEPLAPTLGNFIHDLGPVALYGALGMVLLLISGVINDKLILYQFTNTDEIVEKRNVSVAAIVCATYIGSGLIIAGSIHASLDIVTALIAFGLGQVGLVMFALIYEWATSYDNQKELGENQNTAVGISFGGNLLAYSLILMQGVSMDLGEISGWGDRLLYFGYYVVAGAILLPLLRILNDRVFLPGVRLDDEIVTGRNVNAGLLEAGLALGMGVILVVSL